MSRAAAFDTSTLSSYVHPGTILDLTNVQFTSGPIFDPFADSYAPKGLAGTESYFGRIMTIEDFVILVNAAMRGLVTFTKADQAEPVAPRIGSIYIVQGTEDEVLSKWKDKSRWSRQTRHQPGLLFLCTTDPTTFRYLHSLSMADGTSWCAISYFKNDSRLSVPFQDRTFTMFNVSSSPEFLANEIESFYGQFGITRDSFVLCKAAARGLVKTHICALPPAQYANIRSGSVVMLSLRTAYADTNLWRDDAMPMGMERKQYIQPCGDNYSIYLFFFSKDGDERYKQYPTPSTLWGHLTGNFNSCPLPTIPTPVASDDLIGHECCWAELTGSTDASIILRAAARNMIPRLTSSSPWGEVLGSIRHGSIFVYCDGEMGLDRVWPASATLRPWKFYMFMENGHSLYVVNYLANIGSPSRHGMESLRGGVVLAYGAAT